MKRGYCDLQYFVLLSFCVEGRWKREYCDLQHFSFLFVLRRDGKGSLIRGRGSGKPT